jgi:hypothetical protein
MIFGHCGFFFLTGLVFELRASWFLAIWTSSFEKAPIPFFCLFLHWVIDLWGV